jgi:hypothetical protein
LVDRVFEEVVSDKSFIETCNFFRSHAIRLDQQYEEKSARQIHNSSQSSNKSKKDKVKKVLALINEIQIHDSGSSYEDSVAVPPTKTAMVCKLAQILPEIWMILPLEAKKRETNYSNMPNQYTRVKNLAKEEDIIKEDTDQSYGFVDLLLEEAL